MMGCSITNVLYRRLDYGQGKGVSNMNIIRADSSVSPRLFYGIDQETLNTSERFAEPITSEYSYMLVIRH